MKKSLILIAIILFFAPLYRAQQPIGKTFPDLIGETLDDKAVQLPRDTKGKITLIGMAYSKDAEKELETWLNPVYNKFIAKTGMFDGDYDVNLYFIPMFTGVNQVTAGTTKKKVKEETDKQFHPYVLFYKGDLKKYREQLDFEKSNKPYFFVLDKEGKIIATTSGAYSDEKMEELEDKIP